MENIKNSSKNNTFKISPPTWNGEFELAVGSHSVSNIQEYFDFNYMTQKQGQLLILIKKENVQRKLKIELRLKEKKLSWIFSTWNNAITWNTKSKKLYLI